MPGFDGRVFLEDYEWATYARRMPVRYIKKTHDNCCAVCGKPGTADNPLQHSHRIGFNVGIKKFGLTPDFLDSHNNILSAHRKSCNQAVEMSEQQVLEFIKELGYELPAYLTPSNTQTAPATPSTATRRAAPCDLGMGCQV